MFKGKLQQVIFSGCDITWESDSDERRETCTWYKHFSHKSCCCVPLFQRQASPSHPCFVTALPSTVLSLKHSCHQCYPAYQLSSSTSERPRITQTIQTHWLYLIKGEWPVLPNSSSVSLVVETNIEMAWRAFRGGGLEYVLVMIMTMILMLLSVGTWSSV